jgi:hypothetical protein
MQRAGIAGFSSQNFFGDLLRFLRMFRVQCKRCPLQPLAAVGAYSWMSGARCHSRSLPRAVRCLKIYHKRSAQCGLIV